MLVRLILRVIIMTIIIIWYIIVLLKHRGLNIESFIKTTEVKGVKLWLEKHRKRINGILNILAVVIVIFAGKYVLLFVLDIPYIIENDYCIVEGVVTGNATGKSTASWEQRDIGVLDSLTGEEVKVHVFYERIEEGTYLAVSYLPHTHYGEVISKGND